MPSQRKQKTKHVSKDDADISKQSKNREEREQVDSLHREMEIAGYARGKTGHLVSRVPRKEAQIRSRKRKLLEEQDDKETAILADEEGKRLRGSKAAFEDHVIEGSLIFQNLEKADTEKEANEEDRVVEGDEDNGDVYNDDDEEDENDDEFEDDGTSGEAMLERNDGKATAEFVEDAETVNEKPSTKRKTEKRRMYRLKDFQSRKLAQRHGDALAAHARGQPKLAIEKLKQVARDAPSAPQIYSSLGMVYEDMLKESRRRADRDSTNESHQSRQLEDSQIDTTPDERLPDPLLAEQLDLAKKAYGSYHVSALLCKRDFTLWVRAADSATAIIDIHGKAIILPNLSPQIQAYHRSEKKRWQSEALRDLKVADSLKPAGIDVPAKLASMHIELGNLSEALTILTDLKNRSSGIEGARSEFQSSFEAWLLYSNLMLRIGHECIQWNRGVQTNDNYMFRRWLRKLSKVFDWQERRLQALSLALEAAAGTENTEQFMSWMRKRALVPKRKPDNEENTEKDRWHLEANDGILEQQKYNEVPPFDEKDKWESSSLDNIPNETVVVEEKRKPSRNTILEGDEDDTPSRVAKADAQPLTSAVEAGIRNATHANTDHFEIDKRLLLDKNRAELEAFDATSSDMDLPPDSIAFKDRQDARKAILDSHEDAIRSLECEYDQGKTEQSSPVNETVEEDRMIGTHGQPLPISASCRQVCTVASELIKHLHGLELYTGARLVGEAVSLYLKARAAKRDRRAVSRKRFEEWQAKVARSPFIFESFDKGSDDDSDEDESPYLSDDDDLDNEENEALLGSFRNGILPPELRVLFGLALIGEGGRNFVAAKCIEAIDDLVSEPVSWLSYGDVETKISGEPLWSLFHKAMTEPLGRNAAYAFLADVLRKTEKEEEWATHFSPWFRQHLNSINSDGLMGELLHLRNDLTPYTSFRKNQILKIILATSRFDIYLVESPAKQSPVNRELIVTDELTRIKVALAAIDSIKSAVQLMWKVDANGGLQVICTELVKVLSRFLKWFATVVREKLSYSSLTDLVDKVRDIISYLCGEQIPEIKAELDGEGEMELLMQNSCHPPLETSWQPTEYRPLSLRIYNLSVACNVALFSGWEPEEFTLKLLRRRHGNKHFGVHFHDNKVTGVLPTEAESEIIDQWTTIVTLLPSLQNVGFQKRLATAKQSEWYTSEIEGREQTNRDTTIGRYAEENGIEIFLSFSALCLHLAVSETDGQTRNRLLQMSLSILFPISQFCIDEALWTSDIGEAASSLSGFDEWRLMTDGPDAVTTRDEPKKSRRSRKKERAIEKKVKEWIEGSDKPTIMSFVSVPIREMRSLWQVENEEIQDAKREVQRETSRKIMQKVHKATLQLRACYTEMAIEKASREVSVALLELASQPTCFDPFLCLQQAAMFATQSSKAGTSDLVFRQSLPAMKECTPLEALNILGRADCLHSVYFPNEAAYLCSFVARVCRLHRDRELPDHEWNARWKIVAIYAFNVSVMIRTTVSTVLDRHMQKSFLSMWDRDVVEELERGRRDGVSWKRGLSNSNLELKPGNEDATNTFLNEGDNEDSNSNIDDDEEDADEEEDDLEEIIVKNTPADSYEVFVGANFPEGFTHQSAAEPGREVSTGAEPMHNADNGGDVEETITLVAV